MMNIKWSKTWKENILSILFTLFSRQNSRAIFFFQKKEISSTISGSMGSRHDLQEKANLMWMIRACWESIKNSLRRPFFASKRKRAEIKFNFFAQARRLSVVCTEKFKRIMWEWRTRKGEIEKFIIHVRMKHEVSIKHTTYVCALKSNVITWQWSILIHFHHFHLLKTMDGWAGKFAVKNSILCREKFLA